MGGNNSLIKSNWLLLESRQRKQKLSSSILVGEQDGHIFAPREEFQVGWICALPIEAAAAIQMLDEKFGILQEQDCADTNSYTLGRIGKHYVVIACLPGGQYGTTSATTVAIT